MQTTILRLPDVLDKISVSRSTIYHWVSKGSFPRPIRLGRRAVGWREADVNAWIAARV